MAANVLWALHIPDCEGPTQTHLLFDALSIVLIDLLLAGDNALVIAMAVRFLPPHQRRAGIAFGAATAVVLRVVVTFFAAKLLTVEYLKLVGGVLVLWIALKVLKDTEAAQETSRTARDFMQAVWLIVFADITMSTDNILAVAGASHGSLVLIIFGLCLSIPFVVLSSNLLEKLMTRYPVVVYVGAAILGKVGAEMIVTDPAAVRILQLSTAWVYAAQGLAILLVLLAGALLKKRERARQTAPASKDLH